MQKLIIIFIFFIFNSISLADVCKWDNEDGVPCIEIKSEIQNSSKISKSGINKIVINKKKIEEMAAVDLIDVLKSIPSINITQSGPKGQQASLFMRGTGSNHTLVMINGIPINDQSTTQGLHDFGVDFIQTIQQIEIYPGSSATHFGTNAIGGAINIILTGDYKDSISISSDINKNYEFLSNKTFISDNSSLNFKIGSVMNETISARGNSNDENDKVINYTSNINYENWLDDDLRFYHTNYLRQTIAEYDNSSTNQEGYEGTNNMGVFQFGFEKKNQDVNYKLKTYYNIYDREYDEKGTIDTYESNSTGIKYDISKEINDNISYGFGSEYKYDWGYFDNNGSYQASTKGNSDNIAIYGNIGINLLSNYNFSLFFRNDNHKYTKNNESYKFDLNKTFESLNVGVSHMKGLRNPTLYELFGTDNYGYSGNRNLNPETSYTNEIYTNIILNSNLKLSSRVFTSSIKENIEYVNNQYVNDSDNIDLNQSGFNSEIAYSTNLVNFKIYSSLLSSKKENQADQLRRPEKNYGISLSKKFSNKLIGDYTFNLNYNHYGKHFDTHSSNFSTIEMDSTDLVDLNIIKNNKNGDFFIKITNILDEYYQRPHGYNQDGRIIKLGVRY